MVHLYQRYSQAAFFGIISSPNANCCASISDKLIITAALEKALVWDVKSGICVAELCDGSISSISCIQIDQDLIAIGYLDGI